jgi:hypothetical protein
VDLTSAIEDLFGATACPWRATFALGPCVFAFDTDAAGQLEWLRQYLLWDSPQAGCGAPLDYRVRALVRPREVEDLRKVLAARRPDGSVEFFAGSHYLRHDVGRLRLFVERGDAGGRYVVVQDPAARAIGILLAECCPDQYRQPIRCMREIYLREVEARGGVSLHASCFVRDGKATVIIGGQGAGKTTLCLALGLRPGSEYLSNDKVLLHSGPHGPFVTGFPVACRIGLGTARSIPALAAVLANMHELHREQDTDVAAGSPSAAAFASRQKLEISPAEVVEKLGVGHAHGAPVGRLLLPQLLLEETRPSVDRIDHATATRVIASEIHTPEDEQLKEAWLVPRSKPTAAIRAAAERSVSHLLRDVEILRVRYGTDYIVDGALHPVIAELL